MRQPVHPTKKAAEQATELLAKKAAAQATGLLAEVAIDHTVDMKPRLYRATASENWCLKFADDKVFAAGVQFSKRPSAAL